MVALHGWGKLTRFPEVVADFPDPLGWGRHATLVITIIVELLCGILLMAGILTRLMAGILMGFMLAILFQVHGGDLAKPGAELALIYALGFGVPLLAGGGRFSADEAGGPYSLAAFGFFGGTLAGYPLSYAAQNSEFQTAVPFFRYLTHPLEYMSHEVAGTIAIGVTVGLMLVLTVGGFLVGRAMHRRRVHVVAETAPESSPALTRETHGTPSYL